MTSSFFQSSGKKDSEKHLFILSWNIFAIISIFSLIILVGILSSWIVFEESRFIRFMFHYCNGCCLNFSMIFSKGSWIYFTLTNRSSLHCKRSDRTIFAKDLLNVSATRLLPDAILVLPSISVILFLTLFLPEKNDLTLCQKRSLLTIFFVSRLLKKDLFSLRKRDIQ